MLSDVRVSQPRPLTDVEFHQLNSSVKASVKPHLPMMAAALSDVAHKMMVANQLLEASKAERAQGQKQIEEGKKQREEGQKQIEAGQKQIDDARKEKEAALKRIDAIDKVLQFNLTKVFFGIFSKAAITEDKAAVIFTGYLADKSVTIERDGSGQKPYAKIHKMTGVIKYLTDDAKGKAEKDQIKVCDFRGFKVVEDIPAFADYLKTSPVTAVAFNSGISDLAKTKLAEVVTARAQASKPLKVQYFA